MKLLTKYSLIPLPLKGFLRELFFTLLKTQHSNSHSITGMVKDEPLTCT